MIPWLGWLLNWEYTLVPYIDDHVTPRRVYRINGKPYTRSLGNDDVYTPVPDDCPIFHARKQP